MLSGFTAFIIGSVSKITKACFGKFRVIDVKSFNFKDTDDILLMQVKQIWHDVYNHLFIKRLQEKHIFPLNIFFIYNTNTQVYFFYMTLDIYIPYF